MTMTGKPGEILGALRIILCNDTYADPAIDRKKADEPSEGPGSGSAMVRYWTSGDASLLPLKPDARPVYITIARLPALYLAALMTDTNVERRKMRALLGAFRSAGVEGEKPLLEVLPPSPEPPEGSPFVGTMQDGTLVAPATLVQEIVDRWGYESAQQIGQWALDHARLPKEKRGFLGFWA